MQRFKETMPFGGNNELTKGKPRRIMRRFKLTEISAVDNPAQKGATMVIMKRAEEGNHDIQQDRSAPMARSKQAGHLCYDVEDFDSLEFEHDEDRSAYIEHVHELAKGDFAHLVEVLKKIEPGLTGCEALAKARRMAPNTVAKMNGESGPAYDTKEEALAALSKNEFTALAAHIAKRDALSMCDAMQRARLEAPEAYAEFNGLDSDAPMTKSVASKDKENWKLEVEGEKMRRKCSDNEAARYVARKRPDLRYGKGVTPRSSDLAGMRGSDPTMAGGTAKRDWMFAVAKVQDRDKCSYTEAMSKARREFPAEFSAFQSIGGEQTRGASV